MTSSPEYTKDFVSQHTDNWMKWLGHLAGVQARGLEIGSYEGRSALWFLENILTHERSTLTCIDLWKDDRRHEAFVRNTSNYRTRMNVWRGRSVDILQHPTMGRFDFAYIDGNHDSRYVLADAVQVLPKMRKGGVMIFDDYLFREPGNIGAKEAIDCFLSIYRGHLDVLHMVGQVALQITKRFPED